VAQVIEFPSIPNYSGRVLSLNPESSIRKYQCGGFWLGPNNPVAIVPPNTQMEQLHLAVLDGRLIEVSRDAIKTKHASMDPVTDLGATGLETFVVIRLIDGVKSYSFVTPKDAEQEAAIRKEIEETGTVDLSKYPEFEAKKEVVPHLSPIIITDLVSEKPNE
jgi:hypothetical protein